MTESDPAAAVPATDNNAEAVIGGNDEFEQNKNNAGTSHAQQHEANVQQQQEQDAYDNATAQQDETDAQSTEETE
jgi:hypothetical protein